MLEQHNIHFMPGINEDLPATAVWGSQYVGQIQSLSVDGVFTIRYGKGLGADRGTDAFRHLGVAGANRTGGVPAALARLKPEQSGIVVGSDLVPTSDFSRNPNRHMAPVSLAGRMRPLSASRCEWCKLCSTPTTRARRQRLLRELIMPRFATGRGSFVAVPSYAYP